MACPTHSTLQLLIGEEVEVSWEVIPLESTHEYALRIYQPSEKFYGIAPARIDSGPWSL